MNLLDFDSPEAMAEFIKKNQHTGLAPAQAALEPGGTWVCFHDLDNQHIIWGRSLPPEEALTWERGRFEAKGAEDPVSTARLAVQATSVAAIEAHTLPYNRITDRFGLDEIVPWSRAHLWPVDDRCYAAVEAVEWDHRKLTDEAMRFLLDLAFRQARAFTLPDYGTKAES